MKLLLFLLLLPLVAVGQSVSRTELRSTNTILLLQSSNRVRVTAGANVTVTPSGAGGIMTYAVAAVGSSAAAIGVLTNGFQVSTNISQFIFTNANGIIVSGVSNDFGIARISFAIDPAVVASQANLTAASNALVTILVANDTTTSNGLMTILVANDTTTSNALVNLTGAQTITGIKGFGTVNVNTQLNVASLNVTNEATFNTLSIGSLVVLSNTVEFAATAYVKHDLNTQGKNLVLTNSMTGNMVLSVTNVAGTTNNSFHFYFEGEVTGGTGRFITNTVNSIGNTIPILLRNGTNAPVASPLVLSVPAGTVVEGDYFISFHRGTNYGTLITNIWTRP